MFLHEAAPSVAPGGAPGGAPSGQNPDVPDSGLDLQVATDLLAGSERHEDSEESSAQREAAARAQL